MLYLEDYLEMIEHLPQELRDRFTEIREMDLQVQNGMDSLEEQVKQFFPNAKKLKPDQRDAEYEKIREDYYKALEDADEKVQIANQMYDLVDRYLRRLDQELQKFKMELEADNPGITEVLEKRSLELDKLPKLQNSLKAEKRKLGVAGGQICLPEKRTQSEKVLASVGHEGSREAKNTGGTSSSQSSTSSVSSTGGEKVTTSQSSLSYGLPVGSNAIAAAASQAIAATQQMQQGRRTASLKASYEAINTGTLNHLPNLSREFTLASKDIGSLTSIQTAHESTKKSKKGSSRSNQAQPVEPIPPPSEDSGDSSYYDESNQAVDWTYDPNEPRYCICNQVSYGDMVACDNEDCPFEWFHYPCVGITQPPKGKWFCPQCTAAMKRRGKKEK
ncbi:inhibitor of growth family, member 3 isoform X2 [Tachypleus tridentatus]|uniref:inhibitor of growth family, member 3 isoform X2 n=1 Tax=Tachypleus tridentatus TaxID=6853 RepID=UPI003FD498CD